MSEQDEVNGWAVGLSAFAGVILVLIGVFHIFSGLVGIVDDNFYVVGPEYVFQFDVTTWGWIHFTMGLIALVAGLGIFSGSVFARGVGVFVAGVSAITAFAFIPWYPVWSILIIIVDIAVIWALTMHGRDITRVE